jgi:hypothetical protein
VKDPSGTWLGKMGVLRISELRFENVCASRQALFKLNSSFQSGEIESRVE